MKRIVITGLGVVTPLGLDTESFYKSLIAGHPNFKPENKNYPGHGDQCFSSRVDEKYQKKIISDIGPQYEKYGAGVRYGVYAAQQAVDDAKINLNSETVGDIPVFMGNMEGDQSFLETFIAEKAESPSQTTVGFESDAIPRKISQHFKLSGPVMSIHNTCASANFALDAAIREVRSGRCRAALCGASDPFSLKMWTGFNSLRCLAPQGCRPFSSERGTIVISEGAFVFVIEDYEHAIARGASIYAEVLGVGISNDASHLTNPDSEGVKKAMDEAFQVAKIPPSQIAFVSGHATGTMANDKNETTVLMQIFGEGQIPPVTAIKSTLGHMMSAAGAANLAATCLSFRFGMLPPSLSSDPQDETLPIPVIKNKPQALNGDTALVNAFGFGGNNAVVILKSLSTQITHTS